MYWNTQEIVKLLKSIPNARIEVDSPGGSWDTEWLILTSTVEEPKKHPEVGTLDSVRVIGFIDMSGPSIDDPAAPSAPLVGIEVRTGWADYRGGLGSNSSDEIARIYLSACRKLRDVGAIVVDRHEDLE